MKIKFLLKWLLAILIFAVSFAVVYWYFTTYVQSNKTDTKHIVGRKNIEDVLTTAKDTANIKIAKSHLSKNFIFIVIY